MPDEWENTENKGRRIFLKSASGLAGGVAMFGALNQSAGAQASTSNTKQLNRRTGWLWNELFEWHDPGVVGNVGGGLQPYNHLDAPETKARFASLVKVSGLHQHLELIEAIKASDEDLLLVHSKEHIKKMENLSANSHTGDMGDGFSPFGYGGIEIARLAAGSTISAVKSVVQGKTTNAYALVRPPGHHALPHTGMGFCMFANIALAIAYAKANLNIERVAVVDWDVHHGNGTEACFETDPTVLTISLHQDGIYPPLSGKISDRGKGTGFGSSLNIPLPAGTGIGGYRYAFEQVVLPALARFEPELIIVACGFDAAISDPTGRMMLISEDFSELTSMLMNSAKDLCDGKLVMSHEGGYSTNYVPFCGLAVVETLSNTKTQITDPYLQHWRGVPGRLLTNAQASVINAVATLLKDIPVRN